MQRHRRCGRSSSVSMALVALLCTVGIQSAVWAGPPRLQMTMPDDQPVVTFLSWDTEGGARVERNLLRPGKGVTVAVRVAGQWLSASALPTRMEHPEPNCTQVVLPLAADAELVWELRANGESLTFDWRLTGMKREAVEEIEIRFPFDPGVTPTTIIPTRWDDDGRLSLPAILSAPDFGQLRMTASPADGVHGRLEGSRTDKIVDLIVTIPAACLQPACRLEITPYHLPAPDGLHDTAMWEQARRGWWSIWQPSARWGDQNRPFSAPPGILANNVISDPASCSLWFYADQAFWTPQVAPDIARARPAKSSATGTTAISWMRTPVHSLPPGTMWSRQAIRSGWKDASNDSN